MDKVVITTLGKNITQIKMRVVFEDSKFYVCKEHLNLCKSENQFSASGYLLLPIIAVWLLRQKVLLKIML